MSAIKNGVGMSTAAAIAFAAGLAVGKPSEPKPAPQAKPVYAVVTRYGSEGAQRWEGQAPETVEKMLREQNVTYRFITKKEYDDLMEKENRRRLNR